MNVSIVIVNYNTFELTCRCIHSIYDKTKQLTYEIILVDNASSECNPERFREKFTKIKLIKNKKNMGFAAGNNAGILHANGEAILLLNSDTELVNDAIQLTYDKLKSDNMIGAISGKLIYEDGRVQPVCQRFPSIRNELMELFRLHKFFNLKRRGELLMGNYFSNEYEIEPDWIWGTFFMFPRKILKIFSSGKLPQTFFMYYEDMEWCYDITRNKFKVMYYPQAVIIHHSGSSSSLAEQKKDKAVLQISNEYYFVRKTRGIIYASVYYIVKSLKYLTLSYKRNYFNLAWLYFNAAFSKRVSQTGQAPVNNKG